MLRILPTGYAADEGEQVTRLRQRMRLVSCEEWGCEWFLLGYEGVDSEGHVYRHPVGAPCGDVKACPDPNCLCTARCAQSSDPRILARYPYIADSGVGFIVGHHWGPVQDPAALTFHVGNGRGSGRPVNERSTVADEFVQRTYQGTEALKTIRERGL